MVYVKAISCHELKNSMSIKENDETNRSRCKSVVMERYKHASSTFINKDLRRETFRGCTNLECLCVSTSDFVFSTIKNPRFNVSNMGLQNFNKLISTLPNIVSYIVCIS